MKSRTIVALCFCILVPLAVFAQDKSKEQAPPGMSAAEMEAMTKAMSPGEPHKQLARLAGDWTFTNKMWMAPGAPASESSGTMHGETILGGRYVQTLWQGNMMGMAFEGRGTEGYDNVAKKYVSSWVDNMGTGILYSTGACEADHHRCESKGSMMDPMTGKESYMREVISWTGNDSFVMEMFGPDPSGKEMKWMEMSVKRK